MLTDPYRSIVESAEDPIFISDADCRYVYVNRAAASTLGLTPETMTGKSADELFPPHVAAGYRAGVRRVIESGLTVRSEDKSEIAGVETWFSTVLQPLRDANGRVTHVQGIVRDVTSRKQAEAERAELQAQLAHSQKLESIGRLAGGLAHDFNNILSIIIGSAEMARVEPDRSVVSEHLDEILKASKRSSDLTRQLLGFARRQTALPRVVDLNDFVAASLKMLRRLIGEHVTLSWHPGVDLWPVRIDPGQVDQILVNVVANARDAIGEVGAVVIRTDNVPVSACAQYPGLAPGDYVCLSIVDNGQGMDAETQRRLFEPFFTTKALERGTGLGMASVDGIVRQNNGIVTVQSLVGRGTTVNVFLPREAEAVTVAAAATTQASPDGTETVLVVDDEPGLLRLAVRSLEQYGYTVLTAASPHEALAMVSAHRGPLHILVTDIVMPGMNGWSLAERLVDAVPTLKCLFMSAYTNGVMGEGEKIHEHVHFLQKPFSPTALAAKVRQVLEA